ncbi:TetR/AcrR family transcriptional regulator [Eubacteriales bacterium OttesenSCG-928-G02]|nr:TetR/AcrR family transcriptional regulator [Eubacteriales bacterium OttesenSCG-928-G02]
MRAVKLDGLRSIDDKYAVRSTKGRIVDTAVHLMSEKGHSGASLREIAAEVGINSASIYNHFKSKNEIVLEMLTFYEETQDMFLPNLYTLLEKCKTEDPIKILESTNFYYHPAVQETMDRIMVVASMEFRADEKAKEFIERRLLSLATTYIKPILTKLIELERIEPLDVDGFVILISNYCYSAATRNFSPLMVSMEDWKRGLQTLYGLVKVTGK